jgi:carbon-monoxide dehydrogenase large subunit
MASLARFFRRADPGDAPGTPARDESTPADGFGTAVRRVEDAALVAGAGRYVADMAPADCLHLVFVRSPVGRARLRNLDVAEAAAVPGVRAVFTHADIADLPALGVNPVLGAMPDSQPPFLADDAVRAVGQPIAAIVADSEVQAQDAADLVVYDLDPEPAASGPEAALEAAPVAPGIASNVAVDRRVAEGDAVAAFAGAHVVARAGMAHPRVAPAPLENRAALASWDAAAKTLTIWTGTQTPHRARADLARILGLDAERVRAVAPDVGGAFGLKASLYPEDAICALAARRLGRPVRWIAQRGEDLQAGSHGRGATTRGRMAFDAEGRILAMEADLLFPLGHWMTYSAAVPAWNALRILPGPYDIPALDLRARAVLTNAAPVGIYRGAGRPEAAMLLERLLDAGARALGLDPLELRRRNLLPPERLPADRPGGARLDSGDFPGLLDAAASHADLPALRAEQRRRRAAGELVGIGLCLYVEPCGQGWESARVTLGEDGRFALASGSSSQGQGRRTAYAQILARTLATQPGVVSVETGDTATAPAGVGALASRSTAIGGSAVDAAGRDLIEAARPVAARLLNAAPEAVGLTPRGFAAEDVGRTVTWTDIARAVDAPLVGEAVYTAEGEAWGSGCCVALASVARDTGCVTVERLVYLDDAGTVVNPMLVAGQIAGGVAQGVGEALLESVLYDADGQLVTGSLMDYALPRATDMPPLEVHARPTPSPSNPLGAKGVGEAGTIGAPPAIVNAVLDALAPLGVEDIDMPLTSERVWRAIRAAEQTGEVRT